MAIYYAMNIDLIYQICAYVAAGLAVLLIAGIIFQSVKKQSGLTARLFVLFGVLATLPVFLPAFEWFTLYGMGEVIAFGITPHLIGLVIPAGLMLVAYCAYFNKWRFNRFIDKNWVDFYLFFPLMFALLAVGVIFIVVIVVAIIAAIFTVSLFRIPNVAVNIGFAAVLYAALLYVFGSLAKEDYAMLKSVMR